MSKKFTMKDLPPEEKPYEKCERYGTEALTDGELLAVILRTGSRELTALELSERILKECRGESGLVGLYHISTAELQKIPGIGKVKSIQLKCILELSKRIARQSVSKTIRFQDAASVAAYFMEELRHTDQEEMRLLMLDTKGHLLAEKTVSKGSVNASFVTPREIFSLALQNQAVFIILIHNHPSGDPKPSENDKVFTSRLRLAGEMLGISLQDHIIIGDRRYFSFCEEKLL